MSQLLSSPLLCSFTPPASPTGFSGTMRWLKRTPSTIPLPLSPTKAHESSDGDPMFSTEPLPLIESNFTKVFKSLQTRSSTLSLQHKSSSMSLSTSSVDGSQREATRWLFRPSPVRAIASTPPPTELGDHFTRSLPSYEEKQAELRRRREASKKRVNTMRAYLGAEVPKTIIQAVDDPSTAIQGTEILHRRIDSGFQEHSDGDVFEELQKPHTPNVSEPLQDESPILPPLAEDFLYYAMTRVRARDMREFDCIACSKTHKNALYQRPGVVWILHGCKHFMHNTCFDRLQESEAAHESHDCVNCEILKRMVMRHTTVEMVSRHERLLEATRGSR
ncbi:hypothetical protein EKO04_002852 [Ascochyta lentis]|uniref:Uncharacterized protein n=1 Tax=Ascochyta lentis TaxID=205686 RepID=A0A8H7J718_9PLEO|nr:hypothetical protein EKO04_002852 [Ascochyta lentis]